MDERPHPSGKETAGAAARPQVILCDCDGTIPRKAMRGPLPAGIAATSHASRLCREEVGRFVEALETPGPVLVACTQEAPLFAEIAAQRQAAERVTFFNIREWAGWSREGERAGAKIAALIAAAVADLLTSPPLTREVRSEGRCLIAGPAEAALDMADKVKEALIPTVLITDAAQDVLPPPRTDFPILKGRLRQVSGHFTDYSVVMEEVAAALPWSREALAFAESRERRAESFDMIVEIADAAPRFGWLGRTGYFHARPDDALALAEVARRAMGMVGAFDKTIHATCEARLCAHARNGVSGCTRCLDACPHGAIAPAGDAVRVDPLICEGCGDCAAACPGDAMTPHTPRRADLLRRGFALLRAYRDAGGVDPILLIHGADHGAPLFAALARFGDGLPAHVLPLAVHAATVISHAEMAAFMAAGASRIAVLTPLVRAGELDGLMHEVDLLGAVLEAFGYPVDHRPSVLASADPFEIGEWLWTLERPRALADASFADHLGKRELARLVLETLRARAPQQPDVVPLPAGAPYGAVEVDAQACTLCLACAAACPAGALGDNPEWPQLRFVESACLQCGICRRTCPEGAVRLHPRLDFSPQAAEWRVLAEDEPMTCAACGKRFGTRKGVERVIARLSALDNPHLRDPKRLDLLRYCEDCRVIALARQAGDDPLSFGEPPRPRVTEDYVEEDEE